MRFLKRQQIVVDNREQLQDTWMRNHYIEINDDFKIEDLKPFQKIIVLKRKEGEKRVVVDSTLTSSEIQRLQNQNISGKTDEIKSDRPFRLISKEAIELARSNEAKHVETLDESKVIKKLQSLDPFSDFEEFKEEKVDSEEEVEEQTESEFTPETIETASAIYSDELKSKYKNKLIFEMNPIKVIDSEKKVIPLSFKIRTINDEWDKVDVTEDYIKSSKEVIIEDEDGFEDFEATKKSFEEQLEKSIDEVFSGEANHGSPNQTDSESDNEPKFLNDVVGVELSNVHDHTVAIDESEEFANFNNGNQEHVSESAVLAEEPQEPIDNTLFFKQQTQSNNGSEFKEVYEETGQYPFYRKNYGSPDEYKRIKGNKFTDMVIIRRKINKKLLKDR